MAGLVRRVRVYVEQHGAAYTLRRFVEKSAERAFRFYDRAWRRLAPTEQELQVQREEVLDAGLISVVVPVYNTDPSMLREMVDSLLAQTYQHWEAILFDDCSPSEATRGALASAAELDARIRVHRGERNQGISGGTNSGIALAAGEWIALVDHDDLLTPDALYHVAKTILEKKPELIYSDEDKITEDGRRHTDPHFKPEFCPDDLRSGNYFCHLMVIRKALIEKAGGLRTAFNGSQDHDLALRCVEHTDRVAHIPRVLYHWRSVKSSVSHQNLMKCVHAACAAVQEHMARIGWPGTAEPFRGNIRLKYEIKGQPEVGIYIFGDDKAAMERCAAAMAAQTWPRKAVHTVKCTDAERYAAMNRAAEAAGEAVLLMMDASVQQPQPDLVTELLMYAQRDDVGAVTPKLTDRRQRITHGGFAVDMEGLVQCRQPGIPAGAGGWHQMMLKSHNVAAVSAACLMVRRDHFAPFDEGYTGAMGAVDWSLQMLEKGMRHVFTPHAAAVCENKRLLLLDKEREGADAARYTARWPRVKDPCYSGLLSKRRANHRLGRNEEPSKNT